MAPRHSSRQIPIVLAVAIAAGACAEATPPPPACDADNGGITLPSGFCALVVADLGGGARQIFVRPDGDILVAKNATRDDPESGGVVVLRDTTGDGKADVSARWGPASGGNGLAVSGDQVWFATDDAVLRYTLPAGATAPTSGPDTIVSGLPANRSHRAKSVALAGDGRIFVNIGSPSNVCLPPGPDAGPLGQDPCPELDARAGIWSFDANTTGQSQADGTRFATGIRNAVGITVHNGQLYAMQHGRDQLGGWDALYDTQDNADKPAEEMLAVDAGDDFGWPYCFYDPAIGRKVLAPEYGGDGDMTGRCAEKEDPVFAFPAHWAPNGLLFYTGDQYPASYREGAFIAFHGSWNRAPMPQQGYNVSFLPFNAGAPLASFDIFADGFAGADVSPGGAAHRPVGLAQGPDGSLYITDDAGGRIWRVVYPGE